MKKIMMILAAVAVFTTANAQDEKWYGSKEGGFAITFNANPAGRQDGCRYRSWFWLHQ